MKSANKKLKSTSETKQTVTHTLCRSQSSYNLGKLVNKNTARSKCKNRGLKNLPVASFAILRKTKM